MCEKYTKNYISLNSSPGQIGGFGLHDAAYIEAFPTPGEYAVMPAMGFSYGVPVEAIIVAEPIVIPTGVPFTPIGTAIAVGDAPPVVAEALVIDGWVDIPMAAPIEQPVIPEGYVLVSAEDSAAPVGEEDDGDDDDDGDLNGDDDDDGDEDKEEEEDDNGDEVEA